MSKKNDFYDEKYNFDAMDNLSKKAFSIVVGLLFWIGLVTGIAMAFVLKKKNGREIEKSKNVGLIRFFKNKFAICCDIAMILLFVASVIVVAKKTEAFIGSVMIGLFVFAFEMHCVLNGKIFEYINRFDELMKTYRKLLRELALWEEER